MPLAFRDIGQNVIFLNVKQPKNVPTALVLSWDVIAPNCLGAGKCVFRIDN